LLDVEVEVLFEISLSVGGTLDLDTALHEFVTKNVKLLNRMAGAVVRTSDKKLPEILHALPQSFADNTLIEDILDDAMGEALASPQQHACKNVLRNGIEVSVDFFAIPEFGVLVLCGKPLTLSKNFQGNFRHILRKFSAACRACELSANNLRQTRRFELATKAAKVGTWEMDIATGNIRIDTLIGELFGLKENRFDYSSRDFFHFVLPEDKPQVIAHLRNYIAQGVDDPTEYYFRVQRADGELRKLAANATLVFEGGKPVKVVGANYDVTEAELVRTQSMYRSQLENLLVSISFDLIKNQYHAMDQVITSALCKAGEFVGADRAYRFVYDIKKQTTSNTHEWCADGVDPEITNLQDIPVDAMRLWMTAHEAGLPFFVRNVQDFPVGHSLRNILEPQGIKSLVTIPLMMDETCIGFIGFDAVRKERLWTDVDLTLLRLLADLLVNAEVRLQHESLIQSQNLALISARDQAEQLAQDANQANIAQSRIMARVSHEIRTPLHAILGLADLVLGESPPPHIQQLTQTIRDSGTVLLALINDVLDFSKAESNEVVLNPVNFGLADLLQSLESMFRPLAEKKNLQFSVTTAPGMLTHYVGDRLRIRQIITNLLSNAIKFTSQGAVTLAVSAQQHPFECLRFEVSDTGMGIPQDDLDKLFLPFFQSSNSDSLMLSGTGLGLTISSSLAERMHGRILVVSELGKGSRFTLELPLSAAITSEENSTKLSVISHANVLQGLYILVAEDNPINTQLIKAYLKGVTDNLVCVTDGQQALEATLDRAGGFDVILMDCHMPVMNGFDAARAIRASERGRRRTTIIAVTAGAMEGDKAECLAAGMDDVLSKPFSKNDLIDTLLLRAGRKL
jgi:PAS domain S-box-containing protein